MGSGEVVGEKRGKEDMKTVCTYIWIRITADLHENIAFLKVRKAKVQRRKIKSQREPVD